MLDVLLAGTHATSVELLALDYPRLERRVMGKQLQGTHLALNRLHDFLPQFHSSNLAEL